MTKRTATTETSPPLDAAAYNSVLDLIRSLQPGERRALVLREMDGWSYQQIADFEGVTVEAVRSSLRRARAALKKSLVRAIEEDDAFYEEDEPVEHVREAFRRGVKGTTARP